MIKKCVAFLGFEVVSVFKLEGMFCRSEGVESQRRNSTFLNSDWMTQEQCSHRNNVQTSDKPQVYKVGIYGWRKRCLYFFVLLLMILILINLALTIWILKVMNFTIDGMGSLRITEKGVKLEGDSEFLQPLYAKEIRSKPGRPLFLQSSRNVSVNVVNSNNQLLTQLVTGSSGFKARGKMFEVKSTSGKLLFSADEQEVVVGTERLRVMGAEGAVFSKSVETPHVRAEPFKELRLESPTRSLLMEAPKGIQILAEAGDIQAICRNELRLESKDGEISLDARRIRLMRLPEGKASSGSSSSSGTRQMVYEVCVCPNGRLYLSQAGTGSTCHISDSVCL
ncbi:delta-sarcoglycan isoform X1 [Nerophis lumbriciformis]|uniref:delta-sarcoglycan isoform X1 n=2 Tax=Nerophis lumbriciformis TaxID=546530 RepID=UPI002AE0B0DE|nr:delta-sarcoglycan-like isoform X1 [Nerophis lumbriciformis]XP_061818662.1 delta-sarcoglycan-like isoform X1 [Nerophis lumbriciformis]